VRLPFLDRRPTPIIRPLVLDWSRQAAQIHKHFFARPWTAMEIDDLLRQPVTVADAALDGPGATLLGFAISRIVAPEAELLTIAVDRRRQGAGVGTSLLAAHLSRLSAQRADHVFLEVDEGNAPALKLYRAFGFRQVGERPGYYPGKGGARATALILRANLC
jgi:ribosomal-protein-alanine N-acetyltransferase